MKHSLCRLRWVSWLLLGLALASTPVGRAGSMLREVWFGIGGSSLPDLTNNPAYPANPSLTETLTALFEAPTDWNDNYGQRLRATFIAPLTGNYTFWIASDDASALFLSTDDSPSNRRQIAQVSGWTPSRAWEQSAEQKSEAIPLVAGRTYYVEALQKEGGGGDNLAVRWLRPDGKDEAPIPLDQFIAWGQSPQPPRVSVQPKPVTVVEGGTATFQVDYDNQGPTQVIWRRNGTPLPGVAAKTLVVGPVTLADNGAVFSALLTNALGTVASANATLTVTADTTRPTLVSATFTDEKTVELVFSEPVRPPAGAASASFSLAPTLAVTGVSQPASGPNRLLLATAALTSGTTYVLTVNNVPDRAQTPNVVAPNTSATLTTVATRPFLIEAEDFNFDAGQALPVASVMPYTGGAYAGRVATIGVDFNRSPDGSSPAYRGDSRIPMTENPDLVRGEGAWTMTTNFRLGWIGGGQWYNYTRTVPFGRYRVLAALSHGEGSPGALQGSLQRVTSAPNVANQTVQDLGTFVGDGTGAWGANRLVPLRDGSGTTRTLSLGGTVTLRMNPSSGDYDYLILMPATPPRIAQQPASQSITEGRPVSFSVTTVDNDATSWQWRSNGVPIAGATSASFTLPAASLSANGAQFSVVVGNDIGGTTSADAVLGVVADVVPPTLVRAYNVGLDTVVLEFSEPILPSSLPLASAYQITGGATLLSAAQGNAPQRIQLNVANLAVGTRYTVTVNGVTDRAAAANPLAANATIAFFASELSPANLGSEAVGATVVRADAGAFELTARGGDVGGTADVAGFGWQAVSGNFDLRVRVTMLDAADPFATAGLMARSGLGSNAPFAGVFASTPRAGVFFESRNAASAVANAASIRGGFPVNHPFTWLRLRRVGNDFTGFASLDGSRWTQLGAVNAAMPAQLSVGLSLAGRNADVTAVARFADLGPAPAPTTAPFVPTREGLGVSSRRTRVVLSEIHYNPAASGPGSGPEFVEVFNASDIAEDLSGWSLRGGISYTFPPGTHLAGGQFLVVSADPGVTRTRTGLARVLGPFTGSLNNGGDVIELRDELGAQKLYLEYDNRAPWPVAADGSGHSLVLVNPSFGEADPRAYAASAVRGGNPGAPDPIVVDPSDAVVLNELLAHTDPPLVDFVELYNRGPNPVALDGWVLTDDVRTNRYRFPAGTTLAPRAFLALDESALGFRLNAAGETVFLVSSNGLRVVDVIRLDAQENGVSFGRAPDGAPEPRRLAGRTPGAANDPRRLEDMVINEIMYNPISQDDADEFVELHNRSGAPVDLSGWRLSDAVSFTFPQGVTVPAGGFVVVGADRARLLSNHTSLPPAIVHGNWSGSLRNRGERITLSKPDEILSTNDLGEVTSRTVAIPVGEVAWRDGGRWGKWADGGGSSLELIDPRADPLRAPSWADSDESGKAPWQEFSVNDVLRFGSQTPDWVHLGMLGAGECLVDNVEVLGPTGLALLSNGGFEAGSGTAATGWTFGGHHSRSRVEATGAFAGSRVLRVIAPGDLDAGRNCVRAPISGGLNNDVRGTMRLRARWVAGWPELLMRTRGGGLEMTARMAVPRNLGTPGQPNSRLVANAGPGIHNVSHAPAVPDAGQPVVVTARVSDPDGLSSVNLRFRSGSTGAFSTTAMRDDGLLGDAVAGDGVWSATITGRSAGSLVQFRIEAADGAPSVAWSTFPSGPVIAGLPAVAEANVRWGDPVPFGTYEHIHSWTTPEVDNALNADGLDNTFRDGTLVHGNVRVIYNAGIRRKGSPFTGQADFAVTVPRDDRLLGVTDRVFGLTGNGGEEPTFLRNQMAQWFTRRMGLPYLHAHYIRFFRNGNPHGAVGEDLEQPNNNYAEAWYPDAPEGDLHKVAFWFEFNSGGGFDVVGADLGDYRNPNGQFNLSRYRWNWQGRPNGTTANDFTNFLALVSAANNRSTNYEAVVSNVADMEQWMTMFALDGCMGNWDTWGTGNSQNKYVYYPPGGRWVILPWDMDWVLGAGDGPGRRLFDGNDGNVNYMFAWPAFRRMAWRAYAQAVAGPFQPSQYQPQFDARSASLAFNRINASGPLGIASYLDARREVVRQQIAASDAASFAITVPANGTLASPTPVATVEGIAPFAAADILVNGRTVPTEWIDPQRFRLRIPLSAATNALVLTATDRSGHAIPGMAANVTVTYAGAFQRASDFVVLNEVQYNGPASGTSFVELHNRSTSSAFDLSGFDLEGVGYTFPPGSVLAPGAFLVLARDRVAFASAYGASVPVFGEFPGSLDNGGERIALWQNVGTNRVLVTDVRYDNRLPWPTNADGLGPSLQLIDPSRGSWRVGNWATTATNAANAATPGRANATAQSLAAFPSLWLNEVLPGNLSGPADNFGDRDPFIEIINTGPAAVSLSGLFLSDSVTNLVQWAFPAGLSIPAGGILTVWADGEPGESTATIPHTSFRLNPTNGVVALSRRQGTANAPAAIDYLAWDLLPQGRAFGSVPDGEPRTRRILFNPTPGGTNDPSTPRVDVFINEFMAQNTRTVTDPADGDFDDWIELHNAGTQPVDLAGYYLTDNLTNALASMFRIPGGYAIPPGGFLLVWADNETAQNQPTNAGLHAAFALARSGEQIGLFDPAGNLVDGFSFTAQTNDVSMGRFPDASAPPLFAMESPTPGAANVIAGANRPPVLNPVASLNVPEQAEATFTAVASDPDAGQSFAFSLGSDAPPGSSIHPVTGAFRWTPSESDGPGTFSFLVRATDNGAPPRTGTTRVAINVAEVNRPPVVPEVTEANAGEGQLLSIGLPASDPDLPANTLAFAVDGPVPDGLSLSPTGQLTWIPDESRGGSVVTVAFRVTDNGTPPLSATGLVRVNVAEVNNPPNFPQPAPVTIDELTRLDLPLVAADPEGSPVRFSLEGTVPAGLAIDASAGRISWTPTEAQGPGSYVVLVRARDTSPEQASVVREVLINVREVNQPPVLAPVPVLVVDEGQRIAVRAVASDADLPRQTLRFSLEPGAPAGATINPETGDLEWRLPDDMGASTNRVTVRVTDDAMPNLSATRVVEVVTRARPKLVINEVLRRPQTPGTQFIEIFNRSTNTPWDISGMELVGSSIRFAFPSGTVLAPAAQVVVVQNVAAFRAAFGNGPNVAGAWTGGLGTQFDSIVLRTPASASQPSEILDRLDYDSGYPWAGGTAATNASLQLVDARQDRNRPGNWAVSGAFTGSRNLIRFTDAWRYFQDGPPVSGTNWRTAGFNDSAWFSGEGLHYVENAALPTNKTTALALGQSTYYFRRKVTLPALPPDASLQLTVCLDDGYVLWINGRRAHSLGMDESVDPTHDTFANRVVGDAAFEGPFTLPASLLVPGENTFAVEVHQANVGSSDVVFGLELVLQGGSNSPSTPGAPNNVVASLPEFPPLRINEVVARNTSGLADATGTTEPWIEIVNTSAFPVALDGVFLSDADVAPFKWPFPQGATLPPLGYLVVFADGEPEQSRPNELHANFRLPLTGGAQLRLALTRSVNGQANTIDWFTAQIPSALNTAVGLQPDGAAGSYVVAKPTPMASNGEPASGEPTFGIPTFGPDGRVTLQLRGTPGRRYRIESSTDLGSWWSEAEWTATSSGLTFSVDAGAADQPVLFRAVEVR